jgi:beta-glucosidase
MRAGTCFHRALAAVGALLITVFAGHAVSATLSPAEEARAICQNHLNFSMKVGMMHGYGVIDGYSRNSGCAFQCGRKTFRWDNGPQGFGDGTIPGTTTQWPSSLNVAASFDPKLAFEWGTAMGEEFWGKGTNIQEGPGINVARIMRNGRNFEYISGEDPVLGTMMVAPVVDGIQQNVMAISKHYINNNQETDRDGVNEVVDEVTMMELYGPPFRAAVQKAAGVMCAYNRINGEWACENKRTLRKMLKGIYNFSGFVVSDWGATHSTSAAIQNGLDIEMPRDNFFSEEKIKAAVEIKNISMDDIDDSCTRILSGWLSLPESKRYPCGGKVCIKQNVSTPEHKALARKVAAFSTVLLKNEKGLLPLDASKIGKIALIGIDALGNYTGGQGSGSVVTNAVVSPLDAFTALLGQAKVIYEEGKTIEAAVRAAKAADVAIVFGSAHTGEGHDRASLSLGGNTDIVIPAVAAAQAQTLVVMTVPGSILTPWRDDVPAILTNFFPGEQVGPALGDIVFGNVSPQAKLPVTMPNVENEQGMTTEQYPGVKTGEFELEATYTEGQIVGYRYYDKKGIKPAFPFGHGLGYGTFDFSDLVAKGRTISFAVKRRAGSPQNSCETPQVYLSFPTAATDPKVPSKVLRYFEKVCAESQTVTYEFTDRDVSNWDIASQRWVVTKGLYHVSIGPSSQNILLTASIQV